MKCGVKGMPEMFANNGLVGFVSKPIDVEQINAHLIRFIREK